MDTIYNLKRIKDEAIFLGSGSSINQLDEKYLKDKDIWTSNCFFFHPTIVPQFWHMEMKPHRNGPATIKALDEKKEIYKNVNWIVNQTRPYLLQAIRPDWYENIHSYDPNKVPVQCGASFTIILQIMAMMGYTKIYFSGVDLCDSRYFWTDNPTYNAPKIINSCKPDERSADSVHSTQERGVAEWIGEFLKINDIKGINLSSISLLKNYMETIDE